MSSDGNIALIVSLGVGVLLGFLLLLLTSRVMRRARPRRSRPRAGGRTRRDLRRSRRGVTAPACALRLDASGLTVDGRCIDIPGAVARCKVSGQVELTFAGNSPTRVYLDLIRALTGAGVAITIKRPAEE